MSNVKEFGAFTDAGTVIDDSRIVVAVYIICMFDLRGCIDFVSLLPSLPQFQF